MSETVYDIQDVQEVPSRTRGGRGVVLNDQLITAAKELAEGLVAHKRFAFDTQSKQSSFKSRVLGGKHEFAKGEFTAESRTNEGQRCVYVTKARQGE